MDLSHFELIQQYADGSMDAEERSRFEAEMLKDPSLAEDVKLYLQIEKEMQEMESDDTARALLVTLKKAHFDFENPQPGVAKMQPLRKLAIAASVLLVIFTGAMGYVWISKENAVTIVHTPRQGSKDLVIDTVAQPQRAPRNEIAVTEKKAIADSTKPEAKKITEADRLYAENFVLDGLPQNTEGPIEEALAEFKNGEHAQAIASINEADLDEVTRGQEMGTGYVYFYAPYYQGLSYMALGNMKKAIPRLQDAVSNSPEDALLTKAKWYLALAFLKSADIAAARKLLEDISDNKGSPYYAKAQNLLASL